MLAGGGDGDARGPLPRRHLRERFCHRFCPGLRRLGYRFRDALLAVGGARLRVRAQRRGRHRQLHFAAAGNCPDGLRDSHGRRADRGEVVALESCRLDELAADVENQRGCGRRVERAGGLVDGAGLGGERDTQRREGFVESVDDCRPNRCRHGGQEDGDLELAGTLPDGIVHRVAVGAGVDDCSLDEAAAVAGGEVVPADDALEGVAGEGERLRARDAEPFDSGVEPGRADEGDRAGDFCGQARLGGGDEALVLHAGEDAPKLQPERLEQLLGGRRLTEGGLRLGGEAQRRRLAGDIQQRGAGAGAVEVDDERELRGATEKGHGRGILHQPERLLPQHRLDAAHASGDRLLLLNFEVA